MSNPFVTFPKMLARVVALADDARDGKLAEMVEDGYFDNVETAGQMFDSAVSAAKVAKLAADRETALGESGKVLDGTSWTKGTLANIVKVLETAIVVDPETGERNPVRLVFVLEYATDDKGAEVTDDKGNPIAKVVGKVLGAPAKVVATGGRKGNAKGKMLKLADGTKVAITKANITAHFPNSLAAKVVANDSKPLGTAMVTASGKPYGPNTVLAARDIVKRDPELAALMVDPDPAS